MPELCNEDIKIIQDKAYLGERLQQFFDNGSYGLLNEHILSPLERAAFEAFMKIKPDELSEVIQTQMMGKMIALVRNMITQKINEGKLARETLKNLNDSTQQEDEL